MKYVSTYDSNGRHSSMYAQRGSFIPFHQAKQVLSTSSSIRNNSRTTITNAARLS